MLMEFLTSDFFREHISVILEFVLIEMGRRGLVRLKDLVLMKKVHEAWKERARRNDFDLIDNMQRIEAKVDRLLVLEGANPDQVKADG